MTPKRLLRFLRSLAMTKKGVLTKPLDEGKLTQQGEKHVLEAGGRA